MSLKTIRYNRTKLYKEVWAAPMTKLAKQYGLSDVGLRKVCVKMQVPLPGRGYWAKKQLGKAGPIPPLPSYDGPDELESTIYKSERVEVPIDTAQFGEAQILTAFEKLEKNRIKVSSYLVSLHPVVAQTREVLKNQTCDKYGVLQFYSKHCFNVRIGPRSLKRALLIMNVLLKAFDKRGFKVTITTSKDDYHYSHQSRSSTGVIILGQTIDFELWENTNQILHKLTQEEEKAKKEGVWYHHQRYDYIPSGKLSLRLKGYYGDGIRVSWSDSKKHKLEDCLNDFMVGLINAAVYTRARIIKREKEEQQRLENERRREEIERRREEERARIQVLEKDAINLQKSRLIREYIEAVKEGAIRKEGAIQLGCELDKWFEWANKHADKVDPLIESSPIVLYKDE